MAPRPAAAPLVLLTTLAIGCAEQPAQRATDDVAAPSPADQVAWGEYLAEGLLQCFRCHSERDRDRPGAPPVEGRKGAGRIMRDDGETRLVAPNLTPDTATGIGRWSDAQVIRAIRRGIGHDGRRLDRTMPSRLFRHLSDRDVEAVVAYLRSLDPVHNPLPATRLPPERQRELEEDPPRPLEPFDLDIDDPVELGRRLVRLGECAGCHTAWGAPRNPGLLAGGNAFRDGELYSSNLTPHESGIPYGAEAFIEVIRTGKQGTLDGAMPWFVYRNLSDEHLRAIHAVLQTVTPVAHHVGNHAEPTPCEVCGQVHGLGELNELEQPEAIQLDPGTYSRYTGRYTAEDGMTLVVRAGDEGLIADWDGITPHPIVPLSTTRFHDAPEGMMPVTLRFVLDPNGRAERVIMEDLTPTVLVRNP